MPPDEFIFTSETLVSYYRLWNSIPIVFIIQNVVIIIKRNISNLSQNNS